MQQWLFDLLGSVLGRISLLVKGDYSYDVYVPLLGRLYTWMWYHWNVD